MPVEAIHISAYLDSVKAAGLPAEFGRGRLLALGRVGSVLVDLPYFERFPLGVARYLLARPTAVAPWGDVIHHQSPIGVVKGMLEAARMLRPSHAGVASEVVALALGVASHFAIDRSLHPLVNQLARERAAQLGTEPSREHTEVEKFHSVLFHEDRNGFDFMGKPALREHIALETDLVVSRPHMHEAVTRGFQTAFGEAPSLADWRLWAKGYGQYVWLVSSYFGRTLVPERIKPKVRDELYRGAWGTFDARYAEAVQRSTRAVQAAYALGQDEAGAEAFEAELPEGPIDL